MLRIIYTFTLKNENDETSTHDFFDYAAGQQFRRREQDEYKAACDGELTFYVDWKETEIVRDYTIKPNGEIIWEED